MDDIAALLQGLQDPTAEEKQAALARALSRQRAVGNLGLLTGDRVLGGFGQAQVAQAGQGEAGLMRMQDQASDNRRQTLQMALAAQAKAAAEKRQAEQDGKTDAQRVLSNALREKEIESRDKNTAVMQGLAFGNQGIAAQHLAIAKTEAERKAADKAEHESALDIPFDGGILKARTKGLGDTAVNKVREEAGLYNAALTGMGSLEQALTEYVAKPSLATKANVESRLQATATSLNAAYGQGAMADSERRNIAEALGADVMSPTGVAAVLNVFSGDDPKTAGSLLLSRIRAAKDITKQTSRARFKAYQYDYQPPAAPSPSNAAAGGGDSSVDDALKAMGF